MSDLMLDVDQAGELKAAFRRHGYTNALIKRLCEGASLGDVRLVLEGRARIVLGDTQAPPIAMRRRITIDLSATPKLPFDGATIEPGGVVVRGKAKLEKRRDGQLYINGKKIVLDRVERQKVGTIQGHDLRRELAGVPVLSPVILDALLEHPELIPEDWKCKAVFFWGTIFRHSDVGLCVRCACFKGGRWMARFGWLGDGWDAGYPAARLAS